MGATAFASEVRPNGPSRAARHRAADGLVVAAQRAHGRTGLRLGMVAHHEQPDDVAADAISAPGSGVR